MKQEADLVEVVVSTSRLDLHPFVCGDLKDLVRVLTRDRTITRAEVRAYLEREIESYNRQGFGMMAIIERETGRFIGACGFICEIIDDYREFIMSCRLGSESQKGGHDFEALRALCDFAFDQLDFMRIAMLIKPGCRREIRTAEKLGMELEKEIILSEEAVQLYAINNI